MRAVREAILVSRGFLGRLFSFFSYTPLLALSAITSFARLLLYALLLDVEQFGALSQMLLISTFFGFFGTLGSHYIVERDAPRLRHAEQDHTAIALIAQSVFVTTGVALACLVAPALGFGMFFLSAGELALALVHGWAQRAFATVVIESKSRLAMMQFARQMTARAAVTLVAGVTTALAGGSALAVVSAEVIVTVLMLALLTRSIAHRTNNTVRALVRAGAAAKNDLPWRSSLVLMAGAFAGFGVENLDRWIAAATLDRHSFGHYAFAWTALMGAQSVQFTINNGLLPLLARRASADNYAQSLRLSRLASMGMLAAGVLLAIVAWLFIPMIVRAGFANYEPALPLLVPLIAAAVLRVADFWVLFLIVARGERLLLLTQSSILVLAVLAWIVYTGAMGQTPSSLTVAWLACGLAAMSYAANATAAWIVGPRRGAA